MRRDSKAAGPRNRQGEATTGTCRSATIHGANSGEKRPRLRQIRPMPPQFAQSNQELRLVPSVLFLSDQTNHGQPYTAVDMPMLAACSCVLDHVAHSISKNFFHCCSLRGASFA